MENSRIFWIFVFIGFLCVVVFYLQNKVKTISSLKESFNAQSNVIETFDSSGTSTTGTSSSTTIATIPQPNNIGIYINAFLDLKGNNDTYQTSGWEDILNPSTILFKFNTGIPPAILPNTGFPTKTIAMWGPSSENIAGQNKLLGSFTISFYMQTSQNLNFEVDSNDQAQDIELLQIFMQTPYYVIFYVSPDSTSTTNVNVNALVGNSVYTWNIPASSIVTGNMFSFVVDASVKANTPTMTFYINTANMNVSAPPKITTPTTLYTQQLTLGVSQLIINNGGSLDANLWAFIYYNSILSPTDITTLYTYFTQQQTGYANLQALLAQQAKTAEVLAAAELIKSSSLSYKLEQCSSLVSKLEAETCTSNIVAKTPPKPNWHINAGQASYGKNSDSDLANCSPLDVKTFGSKKTSAPVSSAASSSNVSKESSTSSTTSASPFRIAYPINDEDISTVKYTQKTPAAQAYVPESSPNYANPSSFSFDFGSLKQGIYNFLST